MSAQTRGMNDRHIVPKSPRSVRERAATAPPRPLPPWPSARPRDRPLEAMTTGFHRPTPRSPGQPDSAHRLIWRATAGPGNAGDGHRQLRTRALQHPCHHGLRDRFADCAVRGDQLWRHAQPFGFGFVAVGDHPLSNQALDPASSVHEAAMSPLCRIQPWRSTSHARSRLRPGSAKAGHKGKRCGHDRARPLRQQLTPTPPWRNATANANSSKVHKAATKSSNMMPSLCAQPIG